MILASLAVRCDHGAWTRDGWKGCGHSGVAMLPVEMYQNHLYYDDLDDLQLPAGWALERNEHDSIVHYCQWHATKATEPPPPAAPLEPAVVTTDVVDGVTVHRSVLPGLSKFKDPV